MDKYLGNFGLVIIPNIHSPKESFVFVLRCPPFCSARLLIKQTLVYLNILLYNFTLRPVSGAARDKDSHRAMFILYIWYRYHRLWWPILLAIFIWYIYWRDYSTLIRMLIYVWEFLWLFDFHDFRIASCVAREVTSVKCCLSDPTQLFTRETCRTQHSRQSHPEPSPVQISDGFFIQRPSHDTCIHRAEPTVYRGICTHTAV